VAGNITLDGLYDTFIRNNISSNYGICRDGNVGLYAEEKDRAFTTSTIHDNDHHAINIEVSNTVNPDEDDDWPISDKVFAVLIDLCVDICRRNRIPELIYDGTSNGTLTRHNMFTGTTCPGPYLQERFPEIANEVNRRLDIYQQI
jgi:hypothetical protein